MPPRRRAKPLASTSDEDEADGMDIQSKVRRMHNKLNRSFGAQRAKILAKYRADAQDVQRRTQEKINHHYQKIKDRRSTKLNQLAELVKRRDAKMVATTEKLNALRADLGAFAEIMAAETKRLREETTRGESSPTPAADGASADQPVRVDSTP